MSKTQKSTTIEASLSVCDYATEKYGSDAAFDDCADDFAAAEKDAKCVVRDLLNVERLPAGLTFECEEFIEYDSSNWTHAGAYFTVKVTGPAAVIARIDAAQADEE